MKKISLVGMAALMIAIFPFSAFSDQSIQSQINHNLFAGHFSFDNQLSEQQVVDIGRAILKDDSHFTSLMVVGIDQRTFGLYFQYIKTGSHYSDNGEFAKAYDEIFNKLAKKHYKGHSVDNSVIVLK